jgi:hypothetical protein
VRDAVVLDEREGDAWNPVLLPLSLDEPVHGRGVHGASDGRDGFRRRQDDPGGEQAE